MSASPETHSAAPSLPNWAFEWAAALLTLAAFLLRWAESNRTFLNPDEAQHFLWSSPPNWLELAKASLHPPLPFAVWHWLIPIDSSENTLRLLPILAGALFPYFLYRWLRLLFDPYTALSALILAAFSPNLVNLSPQLRGYCICLLAAPIALLFLEKAFTAASTAATLRNLTLFTLFLILGLLAEMPMLFFIAAVGVYALTRILLQKTSLPFRLAWLASQCLTLLVSVALYKSFARPASTPSSMPSSMPSSSASAGADFLSYLDFAFPSAAVPPLPFTITQSFGQFHYAMSSPWAGYAAAMLFLAALFLLLKQPPAPSKNPAAYPALAAAALTSFATAIVAALLHLYPYAATRHTVILSVFIFAFAAIPLGRLFARLPYLGAAFALTLPFLWPSLAKPDFNNLVPERHYRSAMLAALPQLQAQIPPGTLVYTDRETALTLRYYLRGNPSSTPKYLAQGLQQRYLGSLQFVSKRWDLDPTRLSDDLQTVRALFPNQPILILDAGFGLNLNNTLRDLNNGLPLPGEQNLEDVFTLLPVTPDLQPLLEAAARPAKIEP
jgi:hypothetical protein